VADAQAAGQGRHPALTSRKTVADFDGGRERWLARLDNLRNVVRQEVVARQLASHVGPPPRRVLDIGCGQGTQ
jgi:S-adenosylmethionine-dependent methyltransferase